MAILTWMAIVRVNHGLGGDRVRVDVLLAVRQTSTHALPGRSLHDLLEAAVARGVAEVSELAVGQDMSGIVPGNAAARLVGELQIALHVAGSLGVLPVEGQG